MLQKVQLLNYRSCIDTTMTLQPDLSVLIGPNGSGKTNLLSGLVLLRRLVEHAPGYRYEQHTATGECVLKAWFKVDGKTAILTAKIGLYTDEKNQDAVVGSSQSWYVKDFTGSAKRVHLPLNSAASMGPRGHKHGSYFLTMNARGEQVMHELYGDPDPASRAAYPVLRKIANWTQGITYYSASQFTNPSACPVSIEVETGGEARPMRRGGTAKRFLYDLYDAHREGDASYKSFKRVIGPQGIHLIDKLSFKELKTSSIDYTVRVGGQTQERRLERTLVVPQFRIGRNTLSPNQLSEGTFKTIALLFYMLTKTRTLLLLEEPEVCVHHGLLASILDLMTVESETQQIVVSTHSDFVVDRVEPRSVFAVTRSADGDTGVSSLTKSMSNKERAALHSYLETEGTLGEYWKHGALD